MIWKKNWRKVKGNEKRWKLIWVLVRNGLRSGSRTKKLKYFWKIWKEERESEISGHFCGRGEGGIGGVGRKFEKLVEEILKRVNRIPIIVEISKYRVTDGWTQHSQRHSNIFQSLSSTSSPLLFAQEENPRTIRILIPIINIPIIK